MDLSFLKGKTIHHIDSTKHDGFVVIHFTDGTIWLILAQQWNCAGAKLVHRLA